MSLTVDLLRCCGGELEDGFVFRDAGRLVEVPATFLLTEVLIERLLLPAYGRAGRLPPPRVRES